MAQFSPNQAQLLGIRSTRLTRGVARGARLARAIGPAKQPAARAAPGPFPARVRVEPCVDSLASIRWLCTDRPPAPRPGLGRRAPPGRHAALLPVSRSAALPHRAGPHRGPGRPASTAPPAPKARCGRRLARGARGEQQGRLLPVPLRTAGEQLELLGGRDSARATREQPAQQ